MDKHNQEAHQTSLFKKEISKPPEGYYSSGPNVSLRGFLVKHASQFDPANDHYNVPPFDQPITISNRRGPINDLHVYWSKKPYQAIRQYVDHYTETGDIILDPFCGSGTTAIAALLEGRAVIASDLSPAATFITKHYCVPSDPIEVEQAFDELKQIVREEIDWLYETRCDRCDGKATTASVVHSTIFQCSRCLGEVPLFECIAVESRTQAGKKKTIKVCPICNANGHLEEINVGRNKKMGVVPVSVSYECDEGCTPKRDTRLHNDQDPKKQQYFQKYDVAKLDQIEAEPIPYWYPTGRMLNTDGDQKAWGLLWRPYHGNIVRVDQFYSVRSLRALSLIFSSISKTSRGVDALRFAFSGALLNATKMYRYRAKGGGPQSGNYYMPPIYREIRVWTLLEQKVRNLIRADRIWKELPKQLNICISTQSATDLMEIPDNTVDYIFTDPPYAGKVQYGELNFLWEAWLGFDTAWLDNEIIINDVRERSVLDWENGIRSALRECFRVLKPGRWLSLCYHDSSEGTWQIVQDLVTEIGFIPESTEGVVYIDTGQKSYHQLMDEKITKRDLVINFRKPRLDDYPELILLGNEDLDTFAEKAHAILHDILETHPGSPADRLYDGLVSKMVRQKTYERHDFDELLRSVAEEVDGRWYLLETADQVDETESTKEEEIASHLEAFMNRYLAENLTEQGVHYSDLFEQYLPVQDKPRRLLQHWLPEFFFKTAAGTWRPPANDGERQQKAALRSSGTLRRIKRFGNALLDGVPPADRDRPENAATAADWIRQCRRAGLYELGRALYEKGGLDFTDLSDGSQLEVEEDYQICVRRSS